MLRSSRMRRSEEQVGMRIWKALLPGILLVIVIGIACAVLLIRRGFRATATPAAWEVAVARAVRHLGIPARERREQSPIAAGSETTAQGRELFLTRCAG